MVNYNLVMKAMNGVHVVRTMIFTAIAPQPIIKAIKIWRSNAKFLISKDTVEVLSLCIDSDKKYHKAISKIMDYACNLDEVLLVKNKLLEETRSLNIEFEELAKLLDVALMCTPAARDVFIFLTLPIDPSAEELMKLLERNRKSFKEIRCNYKGYENVKIFLPKSLPLPKLLGKKIPWEKLTEKQKKFVRAKGRARGCIGDECYISVRAGITDLCGEHIDPSIVVINNKPFIVYGDHPNGLATIIRKIATGEAKKLIFYNII